MASAQPTPKAGWEVKTLGEVCEIVNGATPKTKVAEYWEGSHQWITPAEMGNRETPYISNTNRTLTDSGLANCSASLLPAKSVILSSRAPIGHLVINDAPMAFNQGCKGLVPPKDLEYKFLYYFLFSSVELLNSLGTGATFKELSATKLKQVPIPVPPLAEQERIVGILDEAFEGIAAATAQAEKNLHNARELFQSVLQSTFSQKGDDWVETTVGDLCKITHGFAFKGKDFEKDNDSSKPIVITPGNFTEDASLSFTDKNTKRFSGKPPSGFIFDEGDLVVVMTDLSSKMKILGKPAFIDRPDILHNQRIGRVVMADSSVLPELLYYFFRTNVFLSGIKLSATGTMVKHTAPKRICMASFSYPPETTTQQAIVEKLDALSEETKALEAIYERKQSALAELKQSLLQKAFAGEL